MAKIKHILNTIFYSLPIQLLVIQIRKYKLLLIFWLVLLGILSGNLGGSLGLSYLFLEPEYLDKENFWSLLLVGSTLGTFIFAYMITIYINESYRFHFIALRNHPFVTFSFNNFLLPGLLVGIYLYRFTDFHVLTHGGFTLEVVEKLIGLLVGMGLTLLLFASYFFATGKRSIFRTLGDGIERELEGKRNKRIILGKAKASFRSDHKVTHYLRFPFQLVEVEEKPIDFRKLVQALNKNHGNLLLLQIAIFIVIAILGIAGSNPYLQIPAGASLVLVFSLMLMMAGAITFWFRKLGILPLVVLGLFLYLYDNVEIFQERHHAIGMNYEVPPAHYNRTNLEALVTNTYYDADRYATIKMLDAWKAQYQKKYGAHTRPKAVFVCSSGGGLRSSFWNLRVLQELDSLTEGIFTDNIRLFTGASGGMFGTTYFRELHLRKYKGEISSLQDPKYLDNISKDLLNRISFRMFTDIFLPNSEILVGEKSFDWERGYTFDNHLQANIPELKGRRLGDYAKWEKEGIIPPLLLTPTITNQGRKLYISSSPTSFLAKPTRITDKYTSKATGVEFRRLFARQDPDSLSIATALRMNATFPFVLPVIELPSDPPMLVMDAGAIDNYGVQTSIKYLFEFKEWFEENTDGILFVQIRDNSRQDPIHDTSHEGVFSRLMTPLGGGYKSMIESRDMTYDRMLEMVKEWYGGSMEVVSFEYPVETSHNPASISFHLTKREKESILKSVETPHNQTAFSAIKELYRRDVLLARLTKKSEIAAVPSIPRH